MKKIIGLLMLVSAVILISSCATAYGKEFDAKCLTKVSPGEAKESVISKLGGDYTPIALEMKDGHKFVWVTDGIGWQSTSRQLEETFNHIEYLLNLKMLANGLLEDIITNNLFCRSAFPA